MRKHLIHLVMILLLLTSPGAFAQQERITNWDFSSGITGVVSYSDNAAWNEFNFDRNERYTTDADASNGKSLKYYSNKEFFGKDSYGIGQYCGRAQSIIPCPEAGVEYTFSARARVASTLNGEQPGEVALLFYNSSGAVTTLPIFYFSNTIYETQSQTFTVPADAVWCTVWIRKTESVDFYTDWVSLKATIDDTPTAVTSFTAPDIGATEVLLNWTHVAGASGYRIDRKLSSEGSNQWRTIFITIDNGGSSSFLDARDTWFRQLEPELTYNYRIYTLGDYGNSGYTSLTVSTNTLQISPGNTTYNVDATNGNDALAETSQAAAWKSFMNVDRLKLAPGDKVLLKKGESWTEPLQIHGSGAAGNLITIGSYGTGTQKPSINAEGKAHAALRMIDVSYCQVENLELSNYHPYFRELGKFGVEAGTWQNTSVSDIHFDQLSISNVRGSAIRGGNGGSISDGEMTAGIRLATDIRRADPTGRMIYNASITNCVLTNIEQHGMHLGRIDGIIITNNVVNIAGYTCMLSNRLQNGTVSGNYFIKPGFYMTSEDNTGLGFYTADNLVIENNVVYKTYNQASGQSLNMDGCDNCTVEYNFFKDSESGCFVMNHAAANNVLSYNISEGFNDPWFRNLGGVNTKIYNNTAYITATSHSDGGFFIRNTPSVGTGTPVADTKAYNNIFYRENSATPETADLIYDNLCNTGSDYSNNVYFGNFSDPVAEDNNPYFADPLLVNPGSGTLDDVNYSFDADGYQMQAGSPYLSAGLVVSNNGGFDFWGNALPAGAPSIGGHQPESPLYVEMTAFSATKENDRVRLRWETVSEKDNEGFEVQHSVDGSTWRKLTFMEGQGNGKGT